MLELFRITFKLENSRSNDNSGNSGDAIDERVRRISEKVIVKEQSVSSDLY